MTLRIHGRAAAAAAFGLLAAVSAIPSAEAANACAAKAAEGTGFDEKSAKFQVYEALLQATDWGAWSEWMSTGKTTGYKVNQVKYRCKSGGLGVTCHGQTTICKR